MIRWLLLSVLSLAGCGGLTTPELGSGTLAGRLQNASGAAYLYPYGRPELVTRPRADGSYDFPRLPVEIQALVVIDGSPGGWRAALVPVTVASASITAAPDVDAAAMPPAGRVGVVARLAGGSESSATRFTAVGTDRRDVPAAAAGTATVLDPLPAGTFEVLATASGFTSARTIVTVVSSATTAQDVRLSVDSREDAPGCAAEGASCRTGFLCDAASGSCHQCLSDPDCAGWTTGARCLDRVCVASGPAPRALCERCLADSDCGGGVCTAEEFCTRTCTVDGDCPAAFACRDDGTRRVCLPPNGCEEAKEELGSSCFYPAGCAEDLARAVCAGARLTVDPPVPGYCTSRCEPTRPDDCALFPGYACSAISGTCVRN